MVSGWRQWCWCGLGNGSGLPSCLDLLSGRDVVGAVEAVSLPDLIFQLRGDLYRATWQGEGKDPKFVVGPVELELTVVVDSSRGAGASAALCVLDVSAEGKKSTQTTHRIKLTLQPVGPDGKSSKISGLELAGEEARSRRSAEVVRFRDDVGWVHRRGCGWASGGRGGRRISGQSPSARVGVRLVQFQCVLRPSTVWTQRGHFGIPSLVNAFKQDPKPIQ